MLYKRCYLAGFLSLDSVMKIFIIQEET